MFDVCLSGRDQLEKLYSAMDDLVESVKVGDEYCVRMIPRSVQNDYVYIVDGGGYVPHHQTNLTPLLTFKIDTVTIEREPPE